MQFAHVFVGVPVADLGPAVRWYELLLGRVPDMLPRVDEAVWHLTDDASIYVVLDAARAGTALLTLAVTDLERERARLAEQGIPSRLAEARAGQPPKAIITDPAGNLINVFETTAVGAAGHAAGSSTSVCDTRA
jgi:glyoxylase I family protein